MEKKQENEKEYVYIEASDIKPSSSFKLESNSKGVNVKVKVYSCDTPSQLDFAQRECEKRFSALFKKYNNTK